jgi:hypothetical protein
MEVNDLSDQLPEPEVAELDEPDEPAELAEDAAGAVDGVPAAGFKHYLAPAGRSERGTKRKKSDGRVPSWEWFAEAAADDIPAYRVEPARSGRSQCTKCKKPLPKPKAKKAKKAGKKGAEVEEEPVAAAEVVPQRDPFIQEVCCLPA